jgi:hypothetical protein
MFITAASVRVEYEVQKQRLLWQMLPAQVRHPALTPESIAAAEAIVMDNRHVTVNEIAGNLNISHGSAHHIIHDVLKFRKMSAR